ncbi:hypothetical protein BC008_17895 [Mastigocoleus testarum BC008]|uniref:Uncharacterized protein n=1 Tax=Mastigocoleus testarum BC008 TaxID=371196 RepID=A0A0V7ZIT8_9CYAN|nr:hypothetical protein BC008_17895 [Mastigocoleus testarum BC008]
MFDYFILWKSPKFQLAKLIDIKNHLSFKSLLTNTRDDKVFDLKINFNNSIPLPIYEDATQLEVL